MSSLTPRIDNLDNRNYVINGAFDFWQRGTTITTGNNGVYLADRWRNFKSAGGTVTHARDTDTPTLAQSGFKALYSHLYTMTAAQSVAYSCGIVYCMEGHDYANFHGRTARLQFWVKSSIAGSYSFTFNVESINRNYVVPYTINAANTWEQKSIDVTFESSSGVFLDTRRDLLLIWNLGNTGTPGTSNLWQSVGIQASTDVQWSTNAGATFKLSQVMLTPATVPSGSILPFSRAGKTIGDELALCQRYYEKSYDPDVVPGSSVTGVLSVLAQVSGTVQTTNFVFYRATKRANPSVAFWTESGFANQWTYRTSAGVDTNVALSSGSVNGNTAGWRVDTTTVGSGYVTGRGSWAAECEL